MENWEAHENQSLVTGVREWTLIPEARETVLMDCLKIYVQTAMGEKKSLI